MLQDTIVSGIICEYNPFHTGHLYQIDKIKSETGGLVVCVMSGNFVQRGETAVIDKYTRCKMALLSGADLVIEMPVAYATSSAESFGECGVYLLNGLGSVDRLYFGSESDNINYLKDIAKYFESEEYSFLLNSKLQKGTSFPTARMNAVKSSLGEKYSSLLEKPNDILGIEYIKAINKLNSNIEPCSIKRIGSDHDKDNDSSSISAKSIRELIKSNQDVSKFVPNYELLEDSIKNQTAPTDLKNLERAILYKLRTMSEEEISNLPDVGEGLENKIKAAANKAKSLDELYDLIKSKRYAHSRIRRIILHALLDITKDKMYLPEYIRILGMSKNGERILKSGQNKLPFVSRYSEVKKLDKKQIKLFELEASADNIFALCQPTIQNANAYYTRGIIKI